MTLKWLVSTLPFAEHFFRGRTVFKQLWQIASSFCWFMLSIGHTHSHAYLTHINREPARYQALWWFLGTQGHMFLSWPANSCPESLLPRLYPLMGAILHLLDLTLSPASTLSPSHLFIKIRVRIPLCRSLSVVVLWSWAEDSQLYECVKINWAWAALEIA